MIKVVLIIRHLLGLYLSEIDSPDELQSLIRSSQNEYEQLLYIAFKKRREAILKSKATKEDVQITIKSHKQIGHTNR